MSAAPRLDDDLRRELLRSARARNVLPHRLPTMERVVWDLSTWGDYQRRAKWRDEARTWRVLASHDRAAAATFRRCGEREYERTALEDARAREQYAADVCAALRLFPLPPNFWHEGAEGWGRFA